MSGLVNKIKDAMHSDKPTEQPEGTSGPHSSRVGNTADPRIDSDRDHRAAHTSGLAGTGEYSSGGQYTTDSRNTYGTEGPASRTDGPHKSNVLNKADPRVDSDRDHSRNMGANPHGTSGTGAYDATDSTRTGGLGGTTGGLGGTTGGTTGGLGGTTGGLGGTTGGLGGTTGGLGGTGTSGFGSRDTTGLTDNSRTMGASGGAGTTGFPSTGTGAYGSTGGSGLPEGTTGPHSSRAANAADPRIDSDLDNSRNLGARGGAGTTGFSSSGTTGTYGETTTGGMGGSGLGGTGTGTHGASNYGTHGTGPAPGTAGPHKSDMLNKADPRVDSNLDGSKTMGRDKTFDQSNDFAGRDPTDATQVPPSVMQKHIGAPEVAHDHHDAEHSRRHSVSHQEKHRGL